MYRTAPTCFCEQLWRFFADQLRLIRRDIEIAANDFVPDLTTDVTPPTERDRDRLLTTLTGPYEDANGTLKSVNKVRNRASTAHKYVGPRKHRSGILLVVRSPHA